MGQCNGRADGNVLGSDPTTQHLDIPSPQHPNLPPNVPPHPMRMPGDWRRPGRIDGSDDPGRGRRDVLLFERDQFPRFQIGESLMPETYWVFERLGVLDAMKESSMPQKVGVQFVSPDGRESAPFLFHSHDPRECSTTWHVRRADFDQMLLDNASAKGATCRTGIRVLDVIDGDRATGVVAQTDDGDKHHRSVGCCRCQRSIVGRLEEAGAAATQPKPPQGGDLGLLPSAPRDEAGGGVRTMILRTRAQTLGFGTFRCRTT